MPFYKRKYTDYIILLKREVVNYGKGNFVQLSHIRGFYGAFFVSFILHSTKNKKGTRNSAFFYALSYLFNILSYYKLMGKADELFTDVAVLNKKEGRKSGNVVLLR